MRLALVAAGLMVLAPAALGGNPPSERSERNEEEEAPLVGRPADLPFSGAIAPFALIEPGSEYKAPFRLAADASPKRLEAQTPLTFTVTITALAKVRKPPSRLDLRDIPEFSKAFYVEDVRSGANETDGRKERASSSTWRWVYRLKPRSDLVEEVPGLPFVFYNPDLRPAEKGFQVIYTNPIPLNVSAMEPLTPPTNLPEEMMEVATSSRVLAQRSAWRLPGPFALGCLLAAPPLVCACWYLLWRRMYPDAARQTQIRRSRAARRALQALQATPKEHGPARGDWVAATVAGYLRERFDRTPAELTPVEAKALLVGSGCSEELAEKAAALLQFCAAERFPPAPIEEIDLAEQARAFILLVEDGT